MQNTQQSKDKDSILVLIKDWEKMQKELVRLRKKVHRAKILSDVRAAIVSIETEIRNDEEPKGTDAREFIDELLNEK